MTKRLPQTPKEIGFANEYAKTGNATESAARVYDVTSRASAKSIGSENLSKLDLSAYMDEAGLTREYLVRVLKNGLDATKIVGDPGGDFVEAEDYSVRHKYLQTAFKLRDMYPPTKKSIEANQRITINDILSLLDES
jgi:hypothetical protein